MLSEVSDNLSMNAPPTTSTTVNPCISTTTNLHTGTIEPLFSTTQSPPVSLPAVPSRPKDKIISGEFDFTSLLSRAMFLGTHSFEPSKFIIFHLNPEKDDFSICPTPPPCKISSFLTWMEAWNIYLAILIDHAPARAPQLVAYQRIITSVSNQYPLVAWLNYDVPFCTLAASDPSLRWDMQLADLWLECFSGTYSCPHDPMALCATTHYQENCLFRAQPLSKLQRPPPVSTSPGGHLHQVTYPSLEANSVMADLPWNSQAAKGHGRLATLSTAPSAVILPVTSYTCVKSVVFVTVPAFVPTGTVRLLKPMPWTLLRLFILEHEF